MDVLKFGLMSNSSIPTRCATSPTGRSSRDCSRCPASRASTSTAARSVRCRSGPTSTARRPRSQHQRYGGRGRDALALRGGGTVDTSSQRITLDAPPPAPDRRPRASLVSIRTTCRSHRPGRQRDDRPGGADRRCTIMGRPGVLVTVSSQFGANTLKATEAVRRRSTDLKPALEGAASTSSCCTGPASFIERALEQSRARAGARLGADPHRALAFLRSCSAALISFLAIPLSLLARHLRPGQFGQTLNTMTLGGFALALGVLVDDAIIDIENIMRRLRLAKAAGRDDDLQTIEEASIEIRGSMLYGTLAVIFVFLPILFAGGVQGRFIGPMALTFIIAVVASMIVALTVTPALCALMLTGEETKEPPRLVTLMQGLPGVVHGESSHTLGSHGCRPSRHRGGGYRRRAVSAQRADPAVPRRSFRHSDDGGGARNIGRGHFGDGHPHLQRVAEAAVRARRRPPDRPRGSRRGHLEPGQERVPCRADGRA